MKVATWNVNSIRARRERVVEWVGRNEPDVLCLQELKTEDAEFPADEFRELGYEAALFGQRTYNGVAILARGPLRDVELGFGDGVPDPQARFIAATTASGVRVMSAYIPNGEAVGSEKFAYKLAWCERLVAYLQARLAPGVRVALCGDFNVAPAPIDVHDPASWEGHVLYSTEERAAFARIIGCGLVDVVRQLNPNEPLFSWWDYRQLAFPKNHGLRIDHVLVTPALAEHATAARVDRAARKGKLPSDHAPVVVEFAGF
jgi:exodeoxyribonuclease-3